MKTVIWLCLFFVVLAVSCTKEKTVEVPAGILSKEKFTHLLVDLALAESAGNINIKNLPVAQIDSSYAFNPLKENNISQAQYDSTLVFYSNNIALYKEVYETVLAELNAMQTRRDSLKTLPVSK